MNWWLDEWIILKERKKILCVIIYWTEKQFIYLVETFLIVLDSLKYIPFFCPPKHLRYVGEFIERDKCESIKWE